MRSTPFLFAAFLLLVVPAHSQEPIGVDPKPTLPESAVVPEGAVVPALPTTPDPDEPVSYDPELARLATILGSLHYLRNLCGDISNQWRDEMEAIIIGDKMESLRKKRAISAFNDGYQAFSNTYAECSPRAIEAIGKFQTEGAKLTATILTRYKS